ncbi:hypothetical protein WMZ97_16670 [Lentibacillus sp. N15]|uniref:hypothetical protein n=1 Tax=Lentibacillus songyuanensis TaxID=3136161 RepID=UPI0031B9F7E1
MQQRLRKYVGILMVILAGLVFLLDGQEASANAHTSIGLRDGNASWGDGGYRPSSKQAGSKTSARDVDSKVKKAWQKGKITRGHKYPRSIYNPNKGNKLGYDVYQGKTNNDFKKGWRVVPSGGEKFFSFDGWAVNEGYYHHDKHNTATYIGMINTKTKERKIYKARLTNLNAGKDLEYSKRSNSGAINNKCPNTGSGAFQKYSDQCNMEYKWAGFRAYIPLNDLFKNGNEEWRFYIIKAVKGYKRDQKLIYDELVLPYEHEGINWNDGRLILKSGSDLGNMRMTTSDVIRRTKPRSAESGLNRGYFTENKIYKWVSQDENSGVSVWHGVKSSHDKNKTRYANSMYWEFGGSIATLSWKRTKADVTIQHIDAKTNTILEQETIEKTIGNAYTFAPKTKGTYEDKNGYQYIASPHRSDQTKKQKITGDTTIKFYYKVILPDPTRVVEDGEGKNTHGHAKGMASWELAKESQNAESMLHGINNFTPTGTHYAIRNVQHKLKLGDHTEKRESPIALLVNPSLVKNSDMEYDFKYEYTNYYEIKYKCVDNDGRDYCYEWQQDEIVPAWKKPYGQTFKLSDTEGTFTHSTTSRLGRINNKDAIIYNNPTDKNGTKAGDKFGYTYFIKEQAIKGNDVYYRISNKADGTFEQEAIGWVNELDLTTYTHYGMDTKKKILTVDGKGKSYTRAWGWDKQHVHNLSGYKGKKFHVNKTESVGDNVWYRGKIDGKGSDVWIHQSNTDSTETIQIKSSESKVIKIGQSVDSLKLKMDHQHGETFIFDKQSPVNISLLVGREDIITERERITNKNKEEFKVDRKDTKLDTQLWKDISEIIKYKSDFNNYFYVIDGDKYFFPSDLDKNLQEKYKNNTPFSDYGKYAIPLRMKLGQKSATFLSEDNFFVTKKTGFIFSLPYYETSTNRINAFARQEYEDYTNKTFDETDTVVTIPSDGSRYYLNIDLKGGQRPGIKYDDNVVVGKLGLSDITVHLIQDLEFEHYLFGDVNDDPYFVEQATSVLDNVQYENTITLTQSQMDQLKEIEENKEGEIHSFRATDDDEIYDAVNGIVPLH